MKTKDCPYGNTDCANLHLCDKTVSNPIGHCENGSGYVKKKEGNEKSKTG